jgi:hypothetical protein
LLFLNSLTAFGAAWWEGGYIVRYRMVQNIPRDFFDPQGEVDLKTWFPDAYFEWEETPARYKPNNGSGGHAPEKNTTPYE